MIAGADSGGHDIELIDLVRALGLVAGIVVEVDGTRAVQVDQSWFGDPIASLAAMPHDQARRAALVELLACVLPTPLDTPTLDPDGSATDATWFPLPRPSMAEAAGGDGKTAELAAMESAPQASGLFVVTEAGVQSLVAGLGLAASAVVGQTTVVPFVEFPLVSLPPLPGDPVLFISDGNEHRVIAGVRITVTTPVIYAGHSYDTWHIQAGFDATAATAPTVDVFARLGEAAFTAVSANFSTLNGIVDTILRVDDLVEWLERPIVAGNSSGPTIARILVAAGVLSKDADDYALGDLTVLEHLTLQSFLEHALQALAGLRLIEIHHDPNQGLFIEADLDEESGSTRYGVRLAMNDIVLAGPSAPSAEGATLTLQLGKGFEAIEAHAAEGPPGGTPAPTLLEPADDMSKSAEGGEDSEWTDSGSAPGVALTLLEEGKDGTFALAVGVELVSVGFDYADDGPTGILSSHGFQLAGVQPRIYLAIDDHIRVGAAVRLEDLELPIDSTFGATTAGSNPVASTLISSKSTDAETPGKAAGSGSAAPARERFSASVALNAKQTFHATLYDKDRKPTSDPIWFDVERSFGPVALHKLGVSWTDPTRTIAFLVDGGVALAGLDVELKSLSVSIPVRDPSSTSLGLKGLDVSYSAGAISISGGFAEFDTPDGAEYDGEAMIKVGSFTLSALGAYGQLDGHPSLFIFVLIDIPLGGPPCFFIDGVAGGFGYNRGLNLPTLDQLPGYPFVKGAMNDGPDNPFNGKKDPRSALEVLHDTVPPSYGEYWIAAGIRFSTFEMVQSFALLTVMFGTEFELDLLGLSEASVPPGVEDPIANAELALRVTFAPSRGLIAVSAKLTDRSYVFSRTCRLTGGFAFYLWFADDHVSGAPAGQFVITLGGYHPHFIPPAYFPDEPRLGINWQISTALTIKGGLYFALTPAAIMAGGYLSALFDAGIITAWFNAHADFLLGWKPFHYEAGIGIDLGATIRLPVLVATIVITVEVGVDLELWGPAFGGTIVVHLLFICFTIPFGSTVPEPLPIGWDEFVASFLPAAKEPSKDTSTDAPSSHALALGARAGTDAPADQPTAVCGVRVSGGLLKALTDGGPIDWMVDPLHMQLEVYSAVPAKEIELVTPKGTTSLTPSGVVTTFGVGPMAVQDAHFRSMLRVTVEHLNEGVVDPEYDFAVHTEKALTLRGVPLATWNSDYALNHNDLKLINSAPLSLSGVVQGLTLTTFEGPVDETPTPIPLAALQGTLDSSEGRFDWSEPDIPAGNPFASNEPESEQLLETSLVAASTTRDSVVASLISAGVPLSADIDVSMLAANAGDVLLAGPLLCSLGGPVAPVGVGR